jgi:hypothetical protein
MIETGYRRWLGYLGDQHPDELSLAPADRIAPGRVRSFVELLQSEVGSTTVAKAIDCLHYAARLIAPERNWDWLRALKARLLDLARPQDRFDKLVPPWQTLQYAIEEMDAAQAMEPSPHASRRFRDGLMLALLSVSPIRRRSIAALTVTNHINILDDGIDILLHPEDTKPKRAESFRLPDSLTPYMALYLRRYRPMLLTRTEHGGLWTSTRGGRLSADRIYAVVWKLTGARFNKAMGLHDFRRAASTSVAMFAPDKVGIVPGVLHQHSPDVNEKHYNLARSITASRRHAAVLAKAREELCGKTEDEEEKG